MSEGHKYCGKCIFCTSICPGCGSSNVLVKYRPTFEYENDIEDEIELTLTDEDIEIECEDCGESFKERSFQVDDRLNKLRNAVKKQLDLCDISTATCTDEFNEDGSIKIKVQHLKFGVPSGNHERGE